jgi:hypothetical protein
MGMDSDLKNRKAITVEKATIKAQENYQEALTILKQSISEQDKEAALKTYILKQNPEDVLFKTFFKDLGKTIDTLADRELINSLNELYQFIRIVGEKNQVDLYMKRLDSKYAQSFAMMNANCGILQQQAELQKIIMLSFDTKVAFKYIAFKDELDTDINTLHKIKTKISQQYSIDAVNAMLTKLIALRSAVTETYCYQQEYRAHQREKQLLSRIDSAFYQVWKLRKKMRTVEMIYQDSHTLYQGGRRLFSFLRHEQPIQPRVRVVFAQQ